MSKTKEDFYDCFVNTTGHTDLEGMAYDYIKELEKENKIFIKIITHVLVSTERENWIYKYIIRELGDKMPKRTINTGTSL